MVQMKKREYGVILTVLSVVLSLIWLGYTVACWGGWLFISHGNTEMLLEEEGWIARLFDVFPSTFGNEKKTLSIYLHTLPLPLMVYWLTVLLPETLQRGKRKLPSKKNQTILAAAIIGFTALCMLVSTSTIFVGHHVLSFYREEHPLYRILQYYYLYLTPAVLVLALVTWLIPAVVSFFHENSVMDSVKEGTKKALICAAIAFLMICASCLMMTVLGAFNPTAVSLVTSMLTSDASYLISAFSSIIMAPFMEELAFRGGIQHHTAKGMPEGASLLFMALCFGFFHRNIAQFLYTLVFGTVLGLVYARTGKLRYSMLTHALYNLFSVMGYSTMPTSVFGKLTVFPALAKGMFALPPLLAFVLMLVLCFLVVVLIRILGGKRALPWQANAAG